MSGDYDPTGVAADAIVQLKRELIEALTALAEAVELLRRYQSRWTDPSTSRITSLMDDVDAFLAAQEKPREAWRADPPGNTPMIRRRPAREGKP